MTQSDISVSSENFVFLKRKNQPGSGTVKMSTKINPPQYSKDKNYDLFKKEITAWKAVTDLSAKKQGVVVALGLPENDDLKIREKVFEELTVAELNSDDGLDKLIVFMNKHLGKDELEDSLQRFEDFEDYQRGVETIDQYIGNFDQKYARIKANKLVLPSEILAFKLLRRAGLTEEEKMLVLTGMDYEKKDTLYEQAQKSLKKFKGGGCSGAGSGSASAIKVEPTFVTNFSDRRKSFNASGNKYFRGGYKKNGYSSRNNGAGASTGERGDDRRMNPLGADGQPLTCKCCGSFRHFLRDCPDSWENQKKVNLVSQAGHAGGEESAVLFTGFNKQDITRLGVEANNCAVLDSACSSTVCGATWLESYLDSLGDEERQVVQRKSSTRVFKFGGGTRLQSAGEYILPGYLVGKKVSIKTDVVESDIPLLLSRNAMKNAKVKMDIENDSAEILGENISLNLTSSGHYCVPLCQDVTVEDVNAVKLAELSETDRKRSLLKLHRQFAHPVQSKLQTLLKDAGNWKDEFAEQLAEIHAQCKLCKEFAKTPPRPVVALPMAKSFNEVVSMDLKSWRNGRWILYLIDVWSRYTQAVFINRKKPSDVIDNIMNQWIGTFGVMDEILSDNGGEFNSEETRDVASVLNLKVNTTAAESPFQNGLCERIHAVTDTMLLKLEAQYPNTPVEILLRWATMARNSLQMWSGFSSHQLVFGQNPNLPNVLTEKLPALEGVTQSEVFAKHLNSLHAARKAFIETEADERIRRALRHKVRVSEQVFKKGDQVYYKREGHERWLGPGKVLCQDGKLIFVRHGGTFVRVSPNRLIKVEQESKQQSTEESKGSGDTMNLENGERSATCTSMTEELKCDESASSDLRSEDSNSTDFTEERCVDTERCDESSLNETEDKDDADQGVRRSSRIKSKKKCDCKGCDDHVYVSFLTKEQQQSSECLEAKRVELKKLKDFDTYEQVPYAGQSCISTRWVLTMKNSAPRARLVARGFEEKESIQSDSPTIGKSAVRILLATAVARNWKVKTTDIKSAFLQGEQLERDVYVSPPKEAEVPEGYIWKLKRCLYGLTDASRQFYLSVIGELKKLGCKQSKVEPSLFFKTDESGRLTGLFMSHIDDFLHAGDDSFDEEVMIPLRKRFLAGKLEEKDFSYVGFQIHQSCDSVILDQNDYVNNIEVETTWKMEIGKSDESQVELNCQELTSYRSLLGSINWIVRGSRPDMAFELIDLSIRNNSATKQDLHRARKLMRKLKEGSSHILFLNIGNTRNWSLYVYTDASLANLGDGISSTMGIVVFLANHGKACVISWRANKIRRVVKSTLAAETLALMEGLEEALYLKAMMKEIMSDADLPIVATVDNRSLVEAVHSTKQVSDRRLRIDIGCIKQMVDENFVTIKWCSGKMQLANVLTKRGASGKELLSVFHTGQIGLNSA